MKKLIVLASFCLLIPLVAAGPLRPPQVRITETDRARILALFDHARHARPLEKAGVGCVGCHQVGARPDGAALTTEAEVALLTAPGGACHWCHDPAASRKTRGPGACNTCHGADLRPPDHGVDYADSHGADARLGGDTCTSCHRKAWCSDCHERKDSTRFDVHDRTWLTVHGVGALADPASCGTCHLQADCVTCHATGAGRLR